MKTAITWEELVRQEPVLNDLLNEVLEIKDLGGEYFCANEIWRDKKFKKRLSSIVGWEAPSKFPEFMKSEDAYDVVYNKLYKSLPDCRNCSCLSIS